MIAETVIIYFTIAAVLIWTEICREKSGGFKIDCCEDILTGILWLPLLILSAAGFILSITYLCLNKILIKVEDVLRS